ncbi:MAG: hypothetical protein A2017_05995 [Lentisphaerae bacterium GWF2_44_16]|nr:MAG: hypothetical protein A2017_05995 [Lentisphaerae bacterium GWF2_44_16]
MKNIKNKFSKIYFTILELLIVIAVMVILAGLLLPALNKAKEQVRRISCTNNLSQIGNGFLSYTLDNYDHMPPYRDYGDSEKYWFGGRPSSGLIAEYLGKNDAYGIGFIGMNVGKMRRDKFACLSEPAPSGNTQIYTYGYNQSVYKTSKKITIFPNPSITCLLTETLNTISCYYTTSGYYPMKFRHANGANVLFCDSHVSWEKMIEIPDQTIDTTAASNPFWRP